MASPDRFAIPFALAFDAAGAIEPGAKLNFYVTLTTTRKDTYSDAPLSVPNLNPVVADAGGRFGSIFLGSGDYKVVLTDANDVELWTADPVAKSGTNNASTTVAGVIEIATEAEALVGTSTSLAIVPDTAVAMIQQGFTFGATVGGTANAITVTPTILPVALAAGMKFTFKATSTNTSTTTINYASLGVVAAKVNGPSGATAMAGGEIVSGNTYEATYSASDSCWFITGVGEALGSIQSLTEDTGPDWAADWVPSFDISAKLLKKMKLNSLVASQAEMETGTSLVKMVVPGVQHYHPSAAKVWASADVTAGVPAASGSESFNFTSVGDTGTGRALFTIATDFTTATWSAIPSVESNSSGALSAGGHASVIQIEDGKAAGTAALRTTATEATPIDPTSYSLVGFGDN